MGSLDRINRSMIQRDVRAIRREMIDPGVHQREAQARREKLAAQRAARAAAKSSAHQAMLDRPADEHRRSTVLRWAIGLAVALFLAVASGGILASMLVIVPVVFVVLGRRDTAARAAHAETKARAAEAAAAAEASRYLTDADREWLRRHEG